MNLRDLRKQAKMTAKQVADKLGVTETAVYNYESGIRHIDLLTAVDLSLFYGVSIDEFAEAYINTHNQKSDKPKR